ncbi:hypothetical protein C8T65DRAFT_292268 [Cerioporus squamosus]|nr:hypothetical protein C8T65DRAFT_292268 [Cerioporus squamosus]
MKEVATSPSSIASLVADGRNTHSPPSGTITSNSARPASRGWHRTMINWARLPSSHSRCELLPLLRSVKVELQPAPAASSSLSLSRSLLAAGSGVRTGSRATLGFKPPRTRQLSDFCSCSKL